MAIGVRRSFESARAKLASASRAALDVPLADEAELWIGALGRGRRGPRRVPTKHAARAPSARRPARIRRPERSPRRRYIVGRAPAPARHALVACDEAHLVNRYVRPLLRALTKCGALAHFFGRDWISVRHRPAAWVGFAHDRASGRAVIEAFVARETPFALEPRASFLGKEPGTWRRSSARRSTGAPRRRNRRGLADAHGRTAIDRGPLPPGDANEEALPDEPPGPRR